MKPLDSIFLPIVISFGAELGLVVYVIIAILTVGREARQCRCDILDKQPWLKYLLIFGAIVLLRLGAFTASRLPRGAKASH
jgi:hypothetical protein